MIESGAGPNTGVYGYPGLVAYADYSAETYRFCAMKLNADGRVELAGAGDAVIGILYNAPKENEGVQLARLDGDCWWIMVDGTAGDIAPLAFLKSDASGMGVVNTTDNARCFAVSLETSTISVKRRIRAQLLPGCPRY